MRRKCRVWWPKHLALAESPSSFTLLFGWFLSCSSASIDVVVAFASNEDSLSPCQSGFQEILCNTNGRMPIRLQDKSMFSLLGQYATYVDRNDKGLEVESVEYYNNSTSSVPPVTNMTTRESYKVSNCGGCNSLDGSLEQGCPTSVGFGYWIQLVNGIPASVCGTIHWVPRLHHIHWDGEIVSECDVHVVFYEIPAYGVHHFSLNAWKSSEQVKSPCKKPKWVDELHYTKPLVDLDTVLLAINSAAATKTIIEGKMSSKQLYASVSIIHMCSDFMSQVLAFSVASISTLVYIILQFLHSFSSFRSNTWIDISMKTVFHNIYINLQIRCCQFLYWPVFLRDNGFRLRSCIEYAERAALHRHSMWSSLIVDLLLGNLVGLALLLHAESACSHVLTFANIITNELLRSGCVWLMGAPAGFKLNTELARVLGMVSLNAIQIWSTLWVFMRFLFIYYIKALGLLGILFGATVAAALIMDTVSLAALHVSTLHLAISLVYSRQMQALAALWRLFRGRKWNPLRQRLDSYDYSVKQHIVGSLMFTPLLLLLPTTSGFYIFFTILNTTITLVCVLIEVSISVIHGTPYIRLFLWLVKRRIFPSGIWFEFIPCQNDSLEFTCHDDISSSAAMSQEKNDRGKRRHTILVSVLHSNFLSIGQVVIPHYKKVFSGVSRFFATAAYGALTGERTSTALGASLPSTMPWMVLPAREYWCLCYNSVLECLVEYGCDEHQ